MIKVKVMRKNLSLNAYSDKNNLKTRKILIVS